MITLTIKIDEDIIFVLISVILISEYSLAGLVLKPLGTNAVKWRLQLNIFVRKWTGDITGSSLMLKAYRERNSFSKPLLIE